MREANRGCISCGRKRVYRTSCCRITFSRFVRASTISANTKNAKGELQIPISCGGVSVCPGDLIVGDEDGISVIPKRKEEEILEATLEKLRKDQQREQKYQGSREKPLNI